MPIAFFHISHDYAQFMLNRDITPATIVNPGDTIVVEVANASGGQWHRTSTATAVHSLDFSRVNPVTGPIAVHGAQPGDALIVEILSIDLKDWGRTANIPGFGLLSEDFPEAHLRISLVTREYAELLLGLRIPTVPFICTIGVAPHGYASCHSGFPLMAACGSSGRPALGGRHPCRTRGWRGRGHRH